MGWTTIDNTSGSYKKAEVKNIEHIGGYINRMMINDQNVSVGSMITLSGNDIVIFVDVEKDRSGEASYGILTVRLYTSI